MINGLAEGLSGALSAAADRDPGASASSSARSGLCCRRAMVCPYKPSPGDASECQQQLHRRVWPSGFSRRLHPQRSGTRAARRAEAGSEARLGMLHMPPTRALRARQSSSIKNPKAPSEPCHGWASGCAARLRGHRATTWGERLSQRLLGERGCCLQGANRTETQPKARPRCSREPRRPRRWEHWGWGPGVRWWEVGASPATVAGTGAGRHLHLTSLPAETSGVLFLEAI